MPKKPIPITLEGIAALQTIDLEAIFRFHRDPEGHVGFVRKPDPASPPKFDKHGKPKVWESLCAIKTSDLKTMFPEFARFLLYDSYFTLNTYYRPAPFRNAATDLPGVWRKEKYLRRLTSCYADVDCGRPDSEAPGATLPSLQAEMELRALAQAGEIPQPSLFAHSGRGVYCFWLLVDERDPDQSPKAFPEKIALYKRINRALGHRIRTAKLPADISAIDAARVLRVPGSIHRTAQRRVVYIFPADASAKGYVYTLPQLAALLQIDAPETDLPDVTRKLARPAQYRKSKRPGSAPLRSHGPRRLQALRAQDLLTLEAWRGGFLKRGMKYDDGHISSGRRFILSLYARFLRGSGATRAEATKAMLKMAGNCHPRFPSEDDDSVENIAAQVYRASGCQWGNEKLCSILGITEAVALELELRTIKPLSLTLKDDLARPTHEEVVKARREFARTALEAEPRMTCRRLAQLYAQAGFDTIGRQAANEDLNSLGYRVKHGQKGSK